MGNERRTDERIEAIVLIQLDERGYGITRDVSTKGLLIATRHAFKPGDTVEIAVQMSAGAIERIARVVRVEVTPPEDSWRYRIAVELDEALPNETLNEGATIAARFRSSKSP